MHSSSRACLLLAATLATTTPLVAQEQTGPLPGHSFHGEAFNEGPRQKAYLMENTGRVHLPVTTKSPLAQKFFDQGVGQLHGFWYFEAERSFRQAASHDTNCAMAYWGMAMANTSNQKRARDFIKRAVAFKANATPCEQRWIELYAEFWKDDKRPDRERRNDLTRDLEKLAKDFPGDNAIEAKAFWAYHIWNNGSVTNHNAVDTVLKEVFAANPAHPAHHYVIHLWDNKDAKLALDSAAQCGQSEPGTAHMWHMPGHIYDKVKRYDDAVWQMEASARTDHAFMARDHVLPDQIHNYAHNNEWLARNLSHVGRARDAVDLAKNMIELPRHPKFNTTGKGSTLFGRTRLFDTLNRFEMWGEILALADTIYMEPTTQSGEQARRLRLIGLAQFHKGNPAEGSKQIAVLEAMMKREPATATNATPAAATNSVPSSVTNATPSVESTIRAVAATATSTNSAPSTPRTARTSTNALPPMPNRLAIENALAELRLVQAIKATNFATGKEQLAKCKDLSKERQAQYEFAIGNTDTALRLAREAVQSGTNQVQVFASYVDLLYRAQKWKDAFENFYRLRDIASHADLDVPVMQRLAPVAKDLKLPANWKPAIAKKADTGNRPDITKLGPFRWHPWASTDFALASGDGRQISLKSYRGKPVVVIFYLGAGCAHCIEQLNAFAPLAQEFANAGISLLAVSTDSVEGLRATHEKSKQAGGFPFPIASDTSLKTFKAWRAFDDFENQPLHGSFLVDGDGLVRWQDISYQPFMDTKFLLEEAKRLLKQPKARLAGMPDKSTRPADAVCR